GDGLTDPPRGVGRELVALRVVELLDGTDQTEVALLDEIKESHATTGVALGQRHHEAEVRLKEVIFGADAVTFDPLVVATLCGGELLAPLGHPRHVPGGVEAGLDALGELDLLL